MKRNIVVLAVIAVICAVTLSALGEREARPARETGRAISAETRQNMRERWQNMSEEEREQFRARMRERFASGRGRFMNPEAQLESVEKIEQQVARLKESIKAVDFDRSSFQGMSEEERTKLREKFTQARRTRSAALDAIEVELAKLQGRRPPEEARAAEIERLTAIQKMAAEEKATKTAEALGDYISLQQRRGRRGMFMGRRGDRPAREGGDRPERERGDRPNRQGGDRQ